MASTFLSYPAPHLLHNNHFQTKKHFSIKCTSSLNSSSSDSEFPTPDPTNTTMNSPETFPLEKRRRSDIVRQRRPTDVAKAEPPNFEIGWKRTKEINNEKPVGFVVADFLEKLEELMMRNDYGSTELLAKVGEIVAERAREEAEFLKDEGKVEERMVVELFRVLKLMEMDLAMVKAAVKEDTLSERLDQAKARCRQAILVAYSF
ncbi:protein CHLORORESPIRATORY REDUCTION 41, chloroplastic [Vicia villosa]|uniref:protein CHLORORESPIRATORY REDUCTION 41, chloroplastic n=1 Tax=Vicia villosa TaxID=3911 RepID=UPI00273C38BB|nr:protein CHLORORESPIRATORY REDUCTION 41, chloroplastic [Vicia villosa]